MSSRFTFNRHVRDIEYNNSNNSPHSNRSTSHSQTPHSKTNTTPTSISPNNSLNNNTFKTQSQLKTLLPGNQHQSNINNQSHQTFSFQTINSRKQNTIINKTGNNINHNNQENKLVAQQFQFLTVPSDSENQSNSSPLISEPSPNPCAPELILNSILTVSKSTTSPEQQKEEEEEDCSKPIGFHPNISIELDLDNSPSPRHQHREGEEQEEEEEEEENINFDETVFSLSINTNYQQQQHTFSTYSASAYNSSYPTNHSPVSTTSTVDNLTPLYTGILEAQGSLLPDLSLAPLDLVVSPTPIEEHSNILEIVNETPTHCNRDNYYYNNNNNKQQQQQQAIIKTKKLLREETLNYDPSCDSDYDFEQDLNSRNTSYQLLTDQELENKLIKMGCCCSDPSDRMHKANTSSNDITIPIEINKHKNGKEKPSNINTNITQNGKSKDIGKGGGGKIQIEITSEKQTRKKSFADKYFRSNAQVEQRHAKKRKNGKNNNSSPKNGKSSPNNNNDGSVEEEIDPPIPKDASNHPQNGHDNQNISLLDPKSERSDVTDTRTYGEGKDVVSPIPTLDKIHSITERNNKRPSTSALSSPLHSVRLSITPKGHLAPIYIHDPSSMSDEEEDNSISTTDSKEDAEGTTLSINTPVEFLKKHQTITKFVSSQQSQTSDKNVLSRRKRRPGVSERHTLTFSKPPIPAHELPQSPKFTEISLDVMKPKDFLQNILKDNLLFSGVDPEFAQKMVTKVVDLMKAADFDIDEVLMHQGAEGDAFYAVENGNFDILVTNDQGDEKKVAVAKRGDCVGEYALLYNQPRTATLRATEKSRVWGITAEQFAQMRQEIMDWNVERFEKRQEFIHSIPLFQKLEQHELLNMTHACHAEIYEINDYIIKPGAAAKKNTNVYIIMEGNIVISYDRINSNNEDEEEEEEEEERKFNLTLVDIEQEQSQVPIEYAITDEQLIQSDKEEDDNNNNNKMTKDEKMIETVLTDDNDDNDNDNDNKFALNLNVSLGSQRSTSPEIITIKEQISDQQSSKDMSDGKQVFSHPINNTSDPPMDPALLEDIDSQPIRLNLNSGLFTSASNLTDGGGVMVVGGGGGGGRDSGTATATTIRNNQSNRPFVGLALSNVNSLQSVHSVQSIHSVNIIGGHNNGVEINMGICRGDKELGKRDYFARNLFVNQYDDDDDDEIVCARAHTRCKVLKIARDDFVLIMAAQQSGTGQFIYGAIGDGILPDNKIWANQKPDIEFNDLIEQDVLGVGSFGKVTLVKHNKTGETYALKAVSKYRVVKTGQEEHIINEKRVLTMLDSPFCVKLYATFKTETTVYFLTEVVLGGELFTVLRYNVKFDHKATRFYAGCVIMALEHLHSMDIIYRDLKPENLLLNSKGYLQLTDFGFAKKRNTTCTLCGTPQYLAPEVIHNWVQSFATDWWALGVLLFEMVVGHAPFEDDENIKMYEKILVHEPEFPAEMKINSKLRHLIQKLLEKNAYQRLGSGIGGSRQVKLHPFFKTKLDWDLLYDQKIDPPYIPNIDDNFDTSNFDHFSDYEESSDEEDLENIDLNSHHFQWANNF